MLTPPGGGADITLVTWFGDSMPPGSAKLALACENADDAYAELTGRGVQPKQPGGGRAVGPLVRGGRSGRQQLAHHPGA
jgi:hypothetical protein